MGGCLGVREGDGGVGESGKQCRVCRVCEFGRVHVEVGILIF